MQQKEKQSLYMEKGQLIWSDNAIYAMIINAITLNVLW